MTWGSIAPYLADVGVAAVGGLVSTGVYLAYQRWLTDYSRWPYAVRVEATPDPMTAGNFTGRVWIRNPTSATSQFDISLLLEDGKRAWPRRTHATDDPTVKIDGWAQIRPGDAREFEVYPGSYRSRIVGVSLLVFGPFRKRGRERLFKFGHVFEVIPPGTFQSVQEPPKLEPNRA
jgi:hypothetical protein